MKWETRCECGRLMETVEVPPGMDPERVIAAHLDDANVLTCDDAYVWPTQDTGATDHLGRPILVQPPGPPVRTQSGCGAVFVKGPRVPNVPRGVGKKRERVKAEVEALRRKLVETALADHGHMREGAPVGWRDHARRARSEQPEPQAVLRGAGGTEAGRGRLAELPALHRAHVERGGRYDRPRPKPPKPRSTKLPGTVTFGAVEVPPGRVEVVGPWRIDTTEFNPTGRPLVPGACVRMTVAPPPPSDPSPMIQPNNRSPSDRPAT